MADPIDLHEEFPYLNSDITRAFRDRMRDDPSGLVSSLRNAFTSRAHAVFHEDLRSLLGCFIKVYDENGQDVQQDVWRALLGAGLPELYQEMATAPGFFFGHVDLVKGVLLGLLQIARMSLERSYAASRRVLLQNAPSLFKSFWEQRELIPRATAVFPGCSQVVFESIAQILETFIALYGRVGVNPVTPKTFIPHVGFCCWFNLDSSEFAELGLLAMSFLKDYHNFLAVHPTDGFIQEAGVEAYGAEALV